MGQNSGQCLVVVPQRSRFLAGRSDGKKALRTFARRMRMSAALRHMVKQTVIGSEEQLSDKINTQDRGIPPRLKFPSLPTEKAGAES